MTALPWKDEYNINVAVIDQQHHQLADLVSQLHDVIRSHQDPNEIRRVLGELIEFTRLHFATEEELMREHAYPNYTAHQSEHKLLLGQLNALAASLSEETAVAFNPDADLANDWVTKHLLERDVALGKYLNEKGLF